MAAKAKEGRIRIVDVLAGACDEDLIEIREQIAEQERELADLLAERRRKIDALKDAAKLLEVQLHGRPQRKSAAADESGDAAAQPKQLRELIHDLISTEGPLSISQIAAHLAKPKHTIAIAVGKSNWFRRDGDEVCNA